MKGELSDCSTAACVLGSTSAWKEWTLKNGTVRKSRNGPEKVTPACEDRCLVPMALSGDTDSSRKLVVHKVKILKYMIAYFLNSSTSAAPFIACENFFIQDSPNENLSMPVDNI